MDVYLSRLPHCLQVLDMLLKSRGYRGHPYANKTSIEILEEAHAKSISIGTLLSVLLAAGSSTLGLAWVDPVFDAAKGREVMTSAYQLKNAIDKFTTKAESTLIVCYAKLSPDAQRMSQSVGNKVQLMTCQSLAVSLKDHVLVPRHTALTEEQAAEFERARNIKRSQLPMLRVNDPIVAWNNWQVGTIVRIERPQGPFWRVVRPSDKESK